MKRRLNLVIVIVIVAIFIASCTAAPTAPEAVDEPPSNKLRIGFSMATYKEERWLRDRNIFTAKAKEAGFDVIVQNANNNAQRQYEQVVDMIKQDIDVLVIAPHDANDAHRAVVRAKAAGVPVISYDRLIQNADVDVYVSFDNVRVGQMMGEYISRAVPTGGYIILNGAKNDNNSAMFREGYIAAITDKIETEQIHVIAETWVDDWRKEKAYDFTYQTLQAHGDEVNAVIAANDSLAWAAIDALLEQQLSDHVAVVGHDADLAACKRIVKGTQLMTVYKPISRLVDKTIELCIALAAGQPVTADATIDNGKTAVPYVKIAVIAVTKDNLESTVIQDGFHLKEDVFSD